jgi:putative ABC transport system substrate-binding protein
MKRRQFIALMGSAAAWPLACHAQQAMPVIGFLSSRSPSESSTVAAAFRQGLSETGYIVGKNVAIDYRWAEGQYDRLPALAAELISLRVAAILAAGGPPSALAAKAATSTIPIVFSAASDPVGLGLVASLNRPGGNLTGMSTLTTPLVAKGVELLKELLPAATVMAYLANPSNPSGGGESKAALAAAQNLGVALHVLNASTENELVTAFKMLTTLHANGLVVAGEPFFDSRRQKIVELAATHAVPTGYAWRENVVAGGLMSYGTNLADSYRQAGVLAGRVLKGEKPSDLPVMLPTKFELTINLKTAKTLGLVVPPTLLARADEVIE